MLCRLASVREMLIAASQQHGQHRCQQERCQRWVTEIPFTICQFVRHLTRPLSANHGHAACGAAETLVANIVLQLFVPDRAANHPRQFVIALP